MPIVSSLDQLMRERGITGGELAEKIQLSQVNVSRIRTGTIKAMRFSTLIALCEALNCQPGDILQYVPPQTTD